MSEIDFEKMINDSIFEVRTEQCNKIMENNNFLTNDEVKFTRARKGTEKISAGIIYKVMKYQVMDKPYINLNDKKTANHISNMAQELMRRPSTLSIGERELIAAFVSKLNDCQFSYRSHKACAENLMDSFIVEEVLSNSNIDRLSMKIRSLLLVAGDVCMLERENIPVSVTAAKKFGATDQEIHDTIAITSLVNMMNRYVEGAGVSFKGEEPEEYGKSLAKYGYKMNKFSKLQMLVFVLVVANMIACSMFIYERFIR